MDLLLFSSPGGVFAGEIVGVCYCIIGLALLCENYFVPSLQRLSDTFKLSPAVAGATFMAVGFVILFLSFIYDSLLFGLISFLFAFSFSLLSPGLQPRSSSPPLLAHSIRSLQPSLLASSLARPSSISLLSMPSPFLLPERYFLHSLNT